MSRLPWRHALTAGLVIFLAPVRPAAAEASRVPAPLVPAGPVAPFSPAAGLMARVAGPTGTSTLDVSALVTDEPADLVEPPPSRSFQVKATAEGLVGHRTALGIRIAMWSEGAALPSRRGLEKDLNVTYLANGRQAPVRVLDVGPWNTKDAYWEAPAGKPQAESGRDMHGRRTNRAGIDLFNATWYRLLALHAYDRRLIENTSGMVEWSFLK